ncbi:DUF4113 domain-containing protein [Serratia sp. IR-2025]
MEFPNHQGIPDKPDNWKMKRGMLSPAWTTRWTDLPVSH